MKLTNNLKQAVDRYWISLIINIGVSMLFIISMVGISFSDTARYSQKAELAEALIKITVFKSDVTIEYAERGDWPPPRVLESEEDNLYGIIKQIVFDGKGTINVYFNDSTKVFKNNILSFTAAQNAESVVSSILWVCGYASIPNGFVTVGNNITQIESYKLPNSCK